MPNNKKKSLKKIQGGDNSHPYSRKAEQMRRALHRDHKMEIKQSTKLVDQQRKVLFFKFAVGDDLLVATKEDIHDIIQTYVERNDGEIEKLNSELRKGRTKPARLVMLETLRAKDVVEYKGPGIELPDLTKADNVIQLKKWDGDYNGLSLIKMQFVRNPKEVVIDAERTKKIEEDQKIASSKSTMN